MAPAFIAALPLSASQKPTTPTCTKKSFLTGATSIFPTSSRARRSARAAWIMKIGVFYSTTTGNTEVAARIVKDLLGDDADLTEISKADPKLLPGYELIIAGAPTWNTSAKKERSGTSWDEFLYEKLPDLDMTGVSVACFGLGDAFDYGDNFCDAIEELHDCFKIQGAKMLGYSNNDDYEFQESKSIRDGKFLGLPIDNVNGPYDMGERITEWTHDVLKEAGI